MNYDALVNFHDLRISDWGPFSKRYMGISHIANKECGYRLDFCAYPQIQSGKAFVPYIAQGYHPWEANTELTYYTHRHDIVWKDIIYTDISFFAAGENVRVCRAETVNNSSRAINIMLHNTLMMNYTTENGAHKSSEYIAAKPRLAYGDRWIDAFERTEYISGTPGVTESLQYDGKIKGEVLASGFVGARALLFSQTAGDRLSYRVRMEKDGMPHLIIRYKMKPGTSARLVFSGFYDGSVTLSANDEEMQQCDLRVWQRKKGEYDLNIESIDGVPVLLDGFLLCEENRTSATIFDTSVNDRHPQVIEKGENSAIFKYDGCPSYYGVAWQNDMGAKIDNRCDTSANEYTFAVVQGPLRLSANSRKVSYTLLCSADNASEVTTLLDRFRGFDNSELEKLYNASRSDAVLMNGNSGGKAYEPSINRMSAMTLTNIVYPIRCKGNFIRHFTPGRGWDCLYTWDSGFIGLGLSEISHDRAVDCLNAYVTEPGDNETAFIHHGTPLPVQAFLYQDIADKFGGEDFLRHYYSRLKGFHTFLSGRSVGSSTASLGSGLLRTWDYFYNSGGWDDYPAQVYSRRNGLYPVVSPMVTNVHFINLCRILAIAAGRLGMHEDVEMYISDIKKTAAAIEEYAWDGEAGYYSYVLHENGKPCGALRDENGVNMNMGLDGIYPVFDGFCPQERIDFLLGRLFDEERIWSVVGLSTVDMTAPYYNPDGYWNGSVWMPHQWFFSKGLLDLGRPDLYYKIAKRALEVWRENSDESYDCYEVFDIPSARGQCCNHFSGLSTPVLKWYNSLFAPGTVTAGVETVITEHKLSNDGKALYAKLLCHGKQAGVIFVLSEAVEFSVKVNGLETEFNRLERGAVSVVIKTNAALDAPCEKELVIKALIN